jgi:hypothetical protein
MKRMDQNMNKWVEQEIKELESGNSSTLPSLKFEDGKIIEFEIDFSKQFQTKETIYNGKTQKTVLIPVVHHATEGKVQKLLYLNRKNPLHKELLKQSLTGKAVFKVIQIGKQDKTRYSIVE